MTKFIADANIFFADLTGRLAGSEPFFLSRIGGSDTAAVVDYLRAKELGPAAIQSHVEQHLPIVSRYNGFYDMRYPQESYIKYLRCLSDAYFATSLCTLCNYQLLSIYFKETIHPQFYAEHFENKQSYIHLLESVQLNSPEAIFYPYQMIEKITLGSDTLFRVFSKALTGLTVLVVSPFSESINANFINRHNFFRNNYEYPEFALQLVNSPITYADLPAEMYPHNDWFSTLEFLKNQISQKAFDVALLSCGSYAVPIGEYIKNTMKKKAVYVGGVMQLFFGIMGRRYENPFFTDQINVDKFIYPLERDKYLGGVQFPPELAREAFGAYF